MPEPMQPAQNTQKASPQEEATLKLMLANASKLIHGEASDQILKSLQSGQGDPSSAVGVTAFHILDRMVNSMQQAGKQPTKRILQAAALEIIDMLTEMAEAANIVTLEGDQALQEFEAKALKAFADALESAPAGGSPQEEVPQAQGAAPAAPPTGPLGRSMGGM